MADTDTSNPFEIHGINSRAELTSDEVAAMIWTIIEPRLYFAVAELYPLHIRRARASLNHALATLDNADLENIFLLLCSQ